MWPSIGIHMGLYLYYGLVKPIILSLGQTGSDVRFNTGFIQIRCIN